MWMERGRTATADGGEDPLLTSTLIINIQQKQEQMQTGC